MADEELTIKVSCLTCSRLRWNWVEHCSGCKFRRAFNAHDAKPCMQWRLSSTAKNKVLSKLATSKMTP